VPPQKNQRLEALPNVLRNQTVPNQLGGHGAGSDRMARSVPIVRAAIPWQRILAIIIGLLAAASLLAGRS
jgi:hypothetical protein